MNVRVVNHDKVDVLDHGFVRLVDAMGNDLSIVRSARVSHDAVWRTGADEGADEKLIHYLWRNRHTSPFESVEFTFEVKAPIFVFRQWHRHRTWSYNELSGRYSELVNEYYVPDPAVIGRQSLTNKQARDIRDDPAEEMQDAAYLIDKTCTNAFKAYAQLLLMEVPRELARSVLPVSTYSKMFAKVDLRNLFHFLDLRLDPHAQYEIRVYAEAMLELIKPIVPIAVEAWLSNRPKA